jgi:hypothetical protein
VDTLESQTVEISKDVSPTNKTIATKIESTKIEAEQKEIATNGIHQIETSESKESSMRTRSATANNIQNQALRSGTLEF